MRLSSKDKEAIDCFLNRESCESKKFHTDGNRLDGLWMGGSRIVEWIPTRDGDIPGVRSTSSRAEQTVLNYLRKQDAFMPSRWKYTDVDYLKPAKRARARRY